MTNGKKYTVVKLLLTPRKQDVCEVVVKIQILPLLAQNTNFCISRLQMYNETQNGHGSQAGTTRTLKN